ncbi:fas-associated death domain protein-like [Ochlerotatus camptorhynchus]|uniref:fas-associated death domain protein-like n=1 Tax=Ochlerotatus camptorhynchus TaxID=644619 RepID=UPI0031DDEA02
MATSLLKDRPLYEQLCKDYLNLKIIVGNCCVNQPELVPKYKDVLKHDVNSVRKMSQVAGADDLFLLLERRNLMSMIKVQLMIKLDPVTEDVEFSKYLEKYRHALKQHFATIRRFYLEDLRHRDRRTLLEKEIEQAKLGASEEEPTKDETTVKKDTQLRMPSSDHTSANQYSRHRQSIFNLLTKEIVRNWSTFGRFMQLSDSSLEEIEFRHPRNVKAIVGDILETAEREQNENGREFVGALLEALVEFRRKDLKIKIEKMLR